MAYHLEGRLLEVCNCRVLCPCWIGEDPDFGTCDTIVANAVSFAMTGAASGGSVSAKLAVRNTPIHAHIA